MHRWDEFEFFQFVSAPRPPENGPDPTPSQLFAALTATHSALSAEPGGQGAAFAFGWLRPPGASRLSFIAGGRPFFPPAGGKNVAGDLVPILYPPGSVGRRLPWDAAASMLGSLPLWVACAGQPDALWMPEDDSHGDPLRGSLDDYAAHLNSAFGWLVVAEPLPTQVVDDERDKLAVRMPTLRKRENSEQSRLDLQRAEGRYRELTKARVTGFWQVRVLVGGETPTGARAAAALLCSASELDNVPYVLVPDRETGTLGEITEATCQLEDGFRAPFAASSELLLALARPPARELPGIRLVTPHRFDVTPENSDDGGIPLGAVLDEAYRSAGPFTVPRATLNRHAFICGATGSGKSQTMRTLLEALSREDDPVPWLVIEPAKAEYARMAGRLTGVRDVTVIRPGDPDVAPASLNPLEPERGYPLQPHADLLRALFLAAFEGDEPFPQVLSRALTDVYTSAGWDLVSGRPRPATKPKLHLDEPDRDVTVAYPTLGQLQAAARAVVDGIGYGPEITANVRGFVDVRIGSLREGTPGRFFEGGHPLDIGSLLAGNVVLELEWVTNDQDKAFLMGAVLIRIVEHLRIRHQHGRTDGLRHVLVLEEAHRLLKKATSGPAAAAVELFGSLLAEIRAYGEGVVVVEQIPTKILPDVLKNTALKIMHRLPARDDREAVGGTMNLQPLQSELVVSLPSGRAAVATNEMDRPVLVQFPWCEDAESTVGAQLRPPVRAPRSPLCATACQEDLCTLQALSAAGDLATRPRLVVWVETVAVAHVIGQPPPEPARALRDELALVPKRERDCALSHAVERSADARRDRLRTWVDGGDFAFRLFDVVRAQLDGAEPPADAPMRWTAECYRWQVILFALEDAVAAEGEGSPPHVDSQLWAAHGLTLYGDDLGSQLAEVRAHPSFRPGADRVSVGNVRASGLVQAIDALTGSSGGPALCAALRLSCVGDNLDLIANQIEHLLVVTTKDN